MISALQPGRHLLVSVSTAGTERSSKIDGGVVRSLFVGQGMGVRVEIAPRMSSNSQ